MSYYVQYYYSGGGQWVYSNDIKGDFDSSDEAVSAILARGHREVPDFYRVVNNQSFPPTVFKEVHNGDTWITVKVQDRPFTPSFKTLKTYSGRKFR